MLAAHKIPAWLRMTLRANYRTVHSPRILLLGEMVTRRRQTAATLATTVCTLGRAEALDVTSAMHIALLAGRS